MLAEGTGTPVECPKFRNLHQLSRCGSTSWEDARMKPSGSSTKRSAVSSDRISILDLPLLGKDLSQWVTLLGRNGAGSRRDNAGKPIENA